MTKKILAYIDHFHGKVQPSSWEALGVAIDMAADSGGEAAARCTCDGAGAANYAVAVGSRALGSHGRGTSVDPHGHARGGA
ncbi:MAG: hypothetical protein P8Y37_10670, partial [Anaerolineales bacterium]